MVNLQLATWHGDDAENTKFSSWRLYEDGHELPYPHRPHGEIEQIGKGRYSHWGGNLYFSTSDNSDPRSNGRYYSLRRSKLLFLPAFLSKPAKRSSFIIAGVLTIIVLRVITWIAFFPNLLLPIRSEFNRKEFQSFYKNIFALTNPPWESHLSAYFRQFVDREFFQSIEIIDPSIEIAVAMGESSRMFLNHSFDVGTEYYFEHCKHIAEELPHKEFIFFDIKKPEALKKGRFRTLVMIHSLDDFDVPDPSIVFSTFDHLLSKPGRAVFSGYTDHFPKSWFPIHVYKFFGYKGGFNEIKGHFSENMIGRVEIERLSSPFGFKIRKYQESICDRRLIWLCIAEDFLAKVFHLGEVKRNLWAFAPIKYLHVRLNGLLAKGLFNAELKARQRGNRGIDFACHLER